MEFPTEELPNIQREWMSVPMDAANSVLQGAANLAKAPMDIIGKITSLPGRLSQLQSAAGNVGSFLGSSSGLATLGMDAAALAGIDLGPLQQVVSIASLAGGSMDLGPGGLFAQAAPPRSDCTTSRNSMRCSGAASCRWRCCTHPPGCPPATR